MAPRLSGTGKGAGSSNTEASSDLLSHERSEEQTQALINSLHLDIEFVKLESPIASSQVVVSVQGQASFEFLDEDESFQRALAKGERNSSAIIDKWARNCFNKFRTFKGFDVTVPLKDLPAPDCNNLLSKFFDQIDQEGWSSVPQPL